MSKTIGILGGMGSYATADFFKRILDQFDVQKEWEYPKVVIYNNPKLPSRTRAVLYDEESPELGIVEGCLKLEQAGADFIVIPCNSAHAWYDAVAAKVNLPVLSITKIVKDYVVANHPEIKKVGVLGGEVLIHRKLYDKEFAGSGVEVVLADEECQALVRTIIDDIKHNKITSETKRKVEHVAAYFMQKNVQGIILGCTELPLIMNDATFPIPVFDSSTLLAKKAAELAR